MAGQTEQDTTKAVDRLRLTGRTLRRGYSYARSKTGLRRCALVAFTLFCILLINVTPGIRDSTIAAWLVYVVAIAAFASSVEALLGLLVAAIDGGLLLQQTLVHSTLSDKTFIFVAALGAFVLAGLLLIGLIAHTRRVSERARIAQQRAEAAARMRAEFLRVASHDLRSPLTVMLGMTSLIQEKLRREGSVRADWLEKQLQLLQSNTTHMQYMLDEMSDVARLKSNEALSLSLELVDLVGIVQKVATGALSTRLGEKRSITLDFPDEVVVTADGHRLQRVVQNLLDNALKYSVAPQPVIVSVEQLESTAVIRVRDYGVGIPRNELPRVATYEFRATTARRYTGLGIGLAGAKKIVEMHGGKLQIDSTAGKGTTVTVILPRDVAANAPVGGETLVEAGRSAIEAGVHASDGVE